MRAVDRTVAAAACSAACSMPGVAWPSRRARRAVSRRPCAAPTPIDDEAKPPLLCPTENNDVIRGRALRTCSRRPFRTRSTATRSTRTSTSAWTATRAAARRSSHAVPVSVTHYIDRDGKVLGTSRRGATSARSATSRRPMPSRWSATRSRTSRMSAWRPGRKAPATRKN